MKKNFLLASIFIFYMCTTSFISTPIIYYLEHSIKADTEINNFDAIAVLCSGINKEEFPNNLSKISKETLRRVIHSVIIQNIIKKPIIILGGKTIKNDLPESIYAQKVLYELGIDNVIVETESLNTRQNLKFLKNIGEKNKFKKIVLVSSALHLVRAKKIANELGISTLPSASSYYASKPISISCFLPSFVNIEKNRVFFYEFLASIKNFLYCYLYKC